MKVLIVQLVILSVNVAERVKRTPFGGTSSSSYSPSYPAPAPPSYPAPAPAPSYPQPSYPKPSYSQKAQASHNCSIKEEKASVSVCVPSLGSPECTPVTLKGVEVVEKEKCLSITRTVCTEGQGS